MTEWRIDLSNTFDGTPVLLMLPPPRANSEMYLHAVIPLENDLWQYVEAYNDHWEEQMFNVFLQVYRKCELQIPKGQLKWREFASFVAAFEKGVDMLLKAEPRRLGKPPAKQIGEGVIYDGGTKISDLKVMDDGTLAP